MCLLATKLTRSPGSLSTSFRPQIGHRHRFGLAARAIFTGSFAETFCFHWSELYCPSLRWGLRARANALSPCGWGICSQRGGERGCSLIGRRWLSRPDHAIEAHIRSGRGGRIGDGRSVRGGRLAGSGWQRNAGAHHRNRKNARGRELKLLDSRGLYVMSAWC